MSRVVNGLDAMPYKDQAKKLGEEKTEEVSDNGVPGLEGLSQRRHVLFVCREKV